jgi:small subunit ribosomal protein S20
LKRWRQNERRREHNKSVRTAARTAVRRARAAIASGNAEAAQAEIRAASGVLGRASKGNVIHRNAVARHKSRLMRHLNQLGAPAPAAAPKRGRKTTTRTAAKKAPAKRARKAT